MSAQPATQLSLAGTSPILQARLVPTARAAFFNRVSQGRHDLARAWDTRIETSRRESWMRAPGIRGLSLLQPWAALMALGEKAVETRGWSTSYRGLVAIAASKTSDPADIHWALDEYATILGKYQVAKPADFARGAIVALGWLANCVPTERFDFRDYRCPAHEEEFGNYSAGRFAWVFSGIHALEHPLPIKGALGLYGLPADVEAALREAIAQWQV